MRKKTEQTPTDEEIMSYNNVPVEVAAKYISWSSCNIAYALQQERAPFGIAVDTGGNAPVSGNPTYSYNISPGLLVAYKHGKLEAWRMGSLMHLIQDMVRDSVAQLLGQAVKETVKQITQAMDGGCAA